MRRWHVLLIGAVAVLASGVAAVVLVDPERGCACRGAPYLDGTEQTAARFVDAIAADDAAAVWALLTPEAQRRRPNGIAAELPALADRFRAVGVQRWIRGYDRSQGYDTPSLAVLVLVSRATAVSALVVHTRATRDDPGRVDPDLGEPVRFVDSPARTIQLADPSAALRRAIVVPAPSESSAPQPLNPKDLGGGRYELPFAVGLLVVTAERLDGRFAVGSTIIY